MFYHREVMISEKILFARYKNKKGDVFLDFLFLREE